MATRFYLPSTGTSPIASLGYAAEWEASSTAVRRPTFRTKQSTAMTAVGQADATATSNRDAVVGQFISEPLAAQTISGTVKGQIRAQENASTANLRSQCIIRVVQSDNTTIRGTLYAGDLSTLTGNPTNEWATTGTNRPMPFGGSVSLSSLAIQAGDRLVIELGYRKHAAASTTGTLYFGDNAATDLAEDTTTTTANNPWIEFSQTLVLQGDTVTGTTTADTMTVSGKAVTGQAINPEPATFDAATSGPATFSTSGANYTISHTRGTGTNAYALMTVSRFSSTDPTYSATYGGAAMTSIGEATTPNVNITNAMLGLVNPATGAQNAIANPSVGSSVNHPTIGHVLTFFGVHQTTPTGTPVITSGTTGLPSVTVSATAGDLVVALITYRQYTRALADTGADQTRIGERLAASSTNDGYQVEAVSSKPCTVTGDVTLSWQIGGGGNADQWGIVAVALKAAVPPTSETVNATGTTTRTARTLSGKSVVATAGIGASGTITKASLAASSPSLTASANAAATPSVTSPSISAKAVASGVGTTAATSVTARSVAGKTLTGAIHASGSVATDTLSALGAAATGGVGASAATTGIALGLTARPVTAAGISTGIGATSKTTLSLSARGVTSAAQARGTPARRAMTLVPSALVASAVGLGASGVRAMTVSGKDATGIAGMGVVGATSVSALTISAKALTASAATVGLPTRSARSIAYRPVVGTAGAADVGTTLRRTMTIAGRAVIAGAQGVGAAAPRAISVSGKNVSGVALVPTGATGTTLPDVLTTSAKIVSALTTRSDGFGHYPFGHGPFGHAPDVGTSVGATTRKAMNAVGRSMVGQANARATPIRKTLTIIGSAATGRGTVSQTGTITRDTLSVSGKPVVATVPTGSVGVTQRRVVVLSRKNVTAGIGVSATTGTHTLTLVTTSVNIRDRIYQRKSLLVGV